MSGKVRRSRPGNA